MAEDHQARLLAAYEAGAVARDAAPAARWKYAIADRFLAALPEEPRVLDLGAGTGVFGVYFAEKGAAVTAIDLSPTHVAQCRAKGLDARVADFMSEDLGNAVYDGVWAMNTLHHVAKSSLGSVLARIRGALAPGGLALAPGGLALVCVWGGVDHEGIMENDAYDPPRFFSLYTDEQFLAIDPVGMKKIESWMLTETSWLGLHPQLMLLQRP